MFFKPAGTQFRYTNLLHKYLKPLGRKLGMPWCNWHSLAQHSRDFRTEGGSNAQTTQARVGHSTLGHSNVHRPRNLSNLDSGNATEGRGKFPRFGDNGTELDQLGGKLVLATERIQ